MSLQHAITIEQFEAMRFGDLPGHEFHGNQWTGGGSAELRAVVKGKVGSERTKIANPIKQSTRNELNKIWSVDAQISAGNLSVKRTEGFISVNDPALRSIQAEVDTHRLAQVAGNKDWTRSEPIEVMKVGRNLIVTQGNHRVAAARIGGLDRVPVLFLTPADKAAFAYNPDEPRDEHGMWTESGMPVDRYSVQAAVSDYGQNTHSQINDYMRGTRNFRGIAREDGKASAEIMKAAFTDPKLHSTTTQPMTVYRSIDNNGVYLRLSKLKTGDTFSDKAFVSTTKSYELASNITFNADRGAVLLHISLPKGTPYLSGRRDEKELILRNGSKFKITKMQVEKSHHRDEASIAYIWAKIK